MKCVIRTILLIVFACVTTCKADRLVLLAGGGSQSPPCAGTTLQLKEPFYTEQDTQGRLVIAEMAEGQRLLRMDSKGMVQVIAGTGQKGKPGDGAEDALKASFDGVHNIAIHPRTGDIYLADTWNCVVRKYDEKMKSITTIAGTGKKAFSGDGGDALKAELGGIYCVALDPAGDRLYLADLHNSCIRMVDLKSGKIRRVAGNGKKGRPVEGGIAIEQPLLDPRAVAVNGSGDVYVLERGGNALRVVRSDGKIHTVVNKAGIKGLDGADGPAFDCRMNGPKHIQIDQKNRVLIADAENHQILRYDPQTERTERLAGTGKPGSSGLNGPAREAMLNRPHGVYELPGGDIVITDSYNNRILKLEK